MTVEQAELMEQYVNERFPNYFQFFQFVKFTLKVMFLVTFGGDKKLN